MHMKKNTCLLKLLEMNIVSHVIRKFEQRLKIVETMEGLSVNHDCQTERINEKH